MTKFRHSLFDIRLWIFLFFLLRLYAITDPPLEIAHNWRQTTVTMAARNFYEEDNTILFPRIDIAGEKSGVTGMEFPILNYLIYLISKIFGYQHWYGRLINLIVSSFGIFYFYKLIIKYFNEDMAFKAAFLLLFSVWFNYSRKIMPDTFSMSLLLAGIYYGTNYLERKNTYSNLLFYFLLCLTGILSKLPSAYLLILFLFFMIHNEIRLKNKVIFVFTTGLMMSLVLLYYFYWVPYLVQEFGFQHFFMGKSMWNGFRETLEHMDQVSEKFYLDALQIIGFLCFVAGLTLAVVKRNKKLLFIFGITFSGFLIIIFKAGFVFYHHSYYIIPFAPVMALVGAYAIDQIKNKKLAFALLLLVGLENVLNKFHDYYVPDKNLAMLDLEKDLDGFCDRKDLILINSNNLPTPVYFAHRKGWVNSNSEISKKEYIDGLRQKGLKIIIVLKKAFGEDVNLAYPVIFENENYRFYRI